MSFTLTKTPFGPYTKVSVRHGETGNEITIIPEMGARLNHFQVNLHGDSLDIIDGYADAHALTQGVLAKGALLAPFPNRVADGHYQFNDHEYQLEINRPHERNAIHGFMSDRVFVLESSHPNEDFYQLILQADCPPEEGYPFPFSMIVKYRFGGVWLEVETELINTGKLTMPAGFGWHPYFKTSGTIANLRLTLPEVERIEVDERLIPTGKKEKFTNFAAAHPIGTTEFDTGFRLIGEGNEVQLFDEMLGLYITMTFPAIDDQYQYLQIYTAPSRESIAIEPMTCAANAFNNGWGLKKLMPKESLRSHFTIIVS
jgi:aldose 1-epimerase